MKSAWLGYLGRGVNFTQTVVLSLDTLALMSLTTTIGASVMQQYNYNKA